MLLATAAFGFVVLGYIWLTLPDVRPLRKTAPASTAWMDMRAEQARAAGRPVRKNQRWVNYGRISSNLTKAVLYAEDSAFWSHDGIDFDEIKASIEDSWENGEPLRGASTITQQLAKNLYLSPSRNPSRKITEFLIARRLEAELSKQRILELYLNLIEWGDGIWGCEAAARTYFGVSASDLSPEQAALMAGAIINPIRFSPAHPNGRLLRRQAIILRRMGGVTAPKSENPSRSDQPAPPVR